MGKTKIIGIYKIISPVGRIYIGSSVDIKRRWKHYKLLMCKGQSRLYNSLKKHGVENHIFEIIHVCTEEELTNLEKHYIKLHDTFNTKHGLNLSDGGRNCSFSDGTRRKLSESRKGEKNHFFGKTHSPEIKKILSDIRIGTKQDRMLVDKRFETIRKNKDEKVKNGTYVRFKMSDEQKKKLSESKKGRPAWNKGESMTNEQKIKLSEKLKGRPAWNKGVKMTDEQKLKLIEYKKNNPMSEEAKKKISASKKGKKMSSESRLKMSISQKNRVHIPFSKTHKKNIRKSQVLSSGKKVSRFNKNGKHIKTYDSIGLAVDELGIDRSSIIRNCKNKVKTAGGFIWKYA